MVKMRHINGLQKLAHKLLSAMIIISLSFPVDVFAAQVEINEELELMVNGASNPLVPLSTLPKGTILEIPDKFVIKNSDGSINNNSTINNWIRLSFLKPTKYDSNGQVAYDYFFRVKVVKTPNGEYEGHDGFVALSNIAMRDGLQLVTVAPTPISETAPTAPTTPAAPPSTEDPTQIVVSPGTSVYENVGTSSDEAGICVGDSCQNDIGFIAKLKQDMMNVLTNVRNKTATFTRNKRVSGSFNAVIGNFKRNCFGVNFDDFVEVVKKQATANNIPPEVMMGIMTQETAGHCHGPMATGDVTSTSKSLGLFQVNTGSSDVRPCTSQQLTNLRGKTLAQMGSDATLQCLQNPVTNLAEGIKIYLDKFKHTNAGGSPTAGATFAGLPSSEADKHRRALAAYNGGEYWVNTAENDMALNFKNQGIPNDGSWESLRLFFVRQELNRKGYALSASRRGSRSVQNGIGNLAYVEAILGRSSGNNIQSGYAHHWQATLNGPANSVASTDN